MYTTEIINWFKTYNAAIVLFGVGANLLYQIIIRSNPAVNKWRKLIAFIFLAAIFFVTPLFASTSFLSDRAPAFTLIAIALAFLVQSSSSATSMNKILRIYSVVALSLSTILLLIGEFVLIIIDNCQSQTVVGFLIADILPFAFWLRKWLRECKEKDVIRYLLGLGIVFSIATSEILNNSSVNP